MLGSIKAAVEFIELKGKTMRERCKVVATDLNHALRIRNENGLVHVALVALLAL